MTDVAFPGLADVSLQYRYTTSFIASDGDLSNQSMISKEYSENCEKERV
jgi:hypothetical protein